MGTFPFPFSVRDEIQWQQNAEQSLNQQPCIDRSHSLIKCKTLEEARNRNMELLKVREIRIQLDINYLWPSPDRFNEIGYGNGQSETPFTSHIQSSGSGSAKSHHQLSTKHSSLSIVSSQMSNKKRFIYYFSCIFSLYLSTILWFFILSDFTKHIQ